MFAPPYRTAVIGRTGRGDYGHGLDLAVLNQPKLKVVAVADEDAAGPSPGGEAPGGREGLRRLPRDARAREAAVRRGRRRGGSTATRT